MGCPGRRCPWSRMGLLPGRRGYMGEISAVLCSLCQHHKAGTCHHVSLECPFILPSETS